MWQEFKTFVVRGNVMELAIAVVLGAAFGKIVTATVDGILMPLLGLLLGRIDFSNLFVVLNHDKGNPETLAQAKEMGVPVLAYGELINNIVNFLIVALAIFLVVRTLNRLKRPEPVVAAVVDTKPCPYCLSTIPLGATRCPACTSQLTA